ncbi:MAG: hypothetical protein ABI969_06230 [bacterium]
MPLDLALSTNTPTATLELRQAQRLGRPDCIAAFLVVRSGAFAAALPFVFTRDALMTFAESLDRIGPHVNGSASLVAHDGNDVVRFEAIPSGQLRIAGDLHETEGPGQHLQFNFPADWDGLPLFANGLQQLIAATA